MDGPPEIVDGMVMWLSRPGYLACQTCKIVTAVWMPSCELPARRMTASRMWRTQVGPSYGRYEREADLETTEGVLTRVFKGRGRGNKSRIQEVKNSTLRILAEARCISLSFPSRLKPNANLCPKESDPAERRIAMLPVER
jgi:hypothetical protein